MKIFLQWHLYNVEIKKNKGFAEIENICFIYSIIIVHLLYFLKCYLIVVLVLAVLFMFYKFAWNYHLMRQPNARRTCDAACNLSRIRKLILFWVAHTVKKKKKAPSDQMECRINVNILILRDHNGILIHEHHGLTAHADNMYIVMCMKIWSQIYIVFITTEVL